MLLIVDESTKLSTKLMSLLIVTKPVSSPRDSNNAMVLIMNTLLVHLLKLPL
jgi:hypothetical protein